MSERRKIEKRASYVEGERSHITVDIADAALTDLLAGIKPSRVWLVDRGEGVYTFHADQTIGESRKQSGKVAVDELKAAMEEHLLPAIEASDDEAVGDAWDAAVDAYEARTAKPAPDPSVGGGRS